MNKKTKKIALLGVLTSLALVLSYLESLLPPLYSGVPGIKMGLPNLVIIFVLYKFGLKNAVSVSLVRIFAVALLFGNTMTLAYSLAGAILSLGVMSLLKKTDKFTLAGVSIVGGVCHNLGQIAVAIFLLKTVQVGYYMAVLAISGTVAGALVGIAGAMLLKRTEKIRL